MSENKPLQHPIMLTTGMFDLLKAQVVRKKLSPENEGRIVSALKHAVQLLRKDLPSHVVDVYKSVKVLDRTSGMAKIYHFVPPNMARNKNGTTSILSDIGLAVLGHPQGAELQWETKNGLKVYHIESVADLDL